MNKKLINFTLGFCLISSAIILLLFLTFILMRIINTVDYSMNSYLNANCEINKSIDSLSSSCWDCGNDIYCRAKKD